MRTESAGRWIIAAAVGVSLLSASLAVTQVASAQQGDQGQQRQQRRPNQRPGAQGQQQGQFPGPEGLPEGLQPPPGGPGGFGGPEGGPGFPGGPGGMGPGMGMRGAPVMTANSSRVFILRGNELYAFDATSLKSVGHAELPRPTQGLPGGPGGPGGGANR